MKRSSVAKAAGAIFAACLFAALPAGPLAAQSAGKRPAASHRAVLTRGSEAVKGLPNFGRNALPGLYGEYRMEQHAAAGTAALSARIQVWMTPEALYLAPSAWRQARAANRTAWTAVGDAWNPGDAEPSGRLLVLFDRPFVSEGQGAEPRRWSVLVALPEAAESGGVSAYDRFLAVFLDRLAFFLSNAKAPTDASFPAVLEW